MTVSPYWLVLGLDKTTIAILGFNNESEEKTKQIAQERLKELSEEAVSIAICMTSPNAGEEIKDWLIDAGGMSPAQATYALRDIAKGLAKVLGIDVEKI